jgi:DNA polymerase-3 subunit beta
MAATDGARLAERKLPCGWSGPKCTLIVPHRALAEVARAFKGEAGPLQVMVAPAGNQVSVRGSATEVRSRVLDGTYPDYRRIIPPSCSTTIAIDAAELAGRLRAVSVFARDEAHVVRLRATEGALELRAATREVGEASTRLDAAVGGPDSALALNVRYLLDGLARIGGEARLLLDGPLAPVILRRDDDCYTYLIAPIRQPVRP